MTMSEEVKLKPSKRSKRGISLSIHAIPSAISFFFFLFFVVLCLTISEGKSTTYLWFECRC